MQQPGPGLDGHSRSIDLVESDDGSDTMALDEEEPAPGQVFHYLVRGQGPCALAEGTLGTDSQLVERSGSRCPCE